MVLIHDVSKSKVVEPKADDDNDDDDGNDVEEISSLSPFLNIVTTVLAVDASSQLNNDFERDRVGY